MHEARRPAHKTGMSSRVRNDLQVKKVPDQCANTACPNKPHEGQFVLVMTEKSVVSNGVRPLIFWMCSPCANAFTALSGGAVR